MHAHDGVHFVHVISPDDHLQTVWSFVRAGGETRLVPASDVIYDDWEYAVGTALPRLAFP